MLEEIIQQVDETLDLYAQHLATDSITLQAILQEEAWGEIAACARGEGYHDLADFLETAENTQFDTDEEEQVG